MENVRCVIDERPRWQFMPFHARVRIALPGTPSPSDPGELIAAQENDKAVFASGANATSAQKSGGDQIDRVGAQQLRKGGYTLLTGKVTDWLGRGLINAQPQPY
jgi:hypothetical protein